MSVTIGTFLYHLKAQQNYAEDAEDDAERRLEVDLLMEEGDGKDHYH